VNKFARFIRRGSAASLVLVAAASHAAVPAAINTAITEGGTDGAAVAGLVIVAIVGIWVFGLIRKGLGK